MSLGSLWKLVTGYRSPLRVLRCHVLRLFHPVSFLRRRTLARKAVAGFPPERLERMQVMERDGCAPAGPDQDQPLLDEVCATLRKRAGEVQIDTQQAGRGKNFWERLLTDDDRVSDSPFVRLALQPSVIDMASAYLGELPYLGHIGVYLSHGTQNPGWQESQLWHRDYDDRRMFKLFVYCTDVNDEKDGPFTYIPKTISDRVKNTLFPGRISDEEMARQGAAQHSQSIKGPAGTTFYIDTRGCYHLGSRVSLGHTRLAYIITYVTHASLWPFNNNIRIVHPVTEVEKLLLRC